MNNKDTLTIPLSDLGLDNSLPDPVTYQYYKNLKDRKIIINDQIDASIVEMVMIPLLEMDNDGTGRPIEIILNTVGGSLFDGATLCNIIDNLKSPTTITVMTYAYSMGSIILNNILKFLIKIKLVFYRCAISFEITTTCM